MRNHARTSPRKVRCISMRSEWKKRLANEWRSCCQWSQEWLLCLTSALPWHLTALMSFPGIGTGAVEGLLNWGSGTLPSEALCASSQRWTLLPPLCGAAPQCPPVSRRHVAPWPCTAPGLALPVLQTTMTLPLGLSGWAEPGLCWWTKPSWGNEEKANKNKRGKKFFCV